MCFRLGLLFYRVKAMNHMCRREQETGSFYGIYEAREEGATQGLQARDKC